MKYLIILSILALTACSSDPIEQDTTTRAADSISIGNGGITLKVDTAWSETIVIPF